MVSLDKIEHVCLAKISAVEVVRECLSMSTVSLSDVITRLEHVEHDVKGVLDFGLALRYTVKLLNQFDIRVTHTRAPKK